MEAMETPGKGWKENHPSGKGFCQRKDRPSHVYLDEIEVIGVENITYQHFPPVHDRIPRDSSGILPSLG
jgi:hypothetical protein